MNYAQRHSKFLAVGTVCIALTAGACALTSKAEVVNVRYFSPERVDPHRNDSASNPAALAADSKGQLQVNLGRVTSGASLRERIAYRDSTYELGYYEELRWTERPDTFVRRALAHALFEAHGLQRVFGGTVPTLDIEVIAFDELRLKSSRAARVQLGMILYEDTGVIFEDTLTVDRQVRGEKSRIEEVIAAMSTALDAAAETIALRVQAALVQKRSTTPADEPP